jgi:hypothetical protein
MLQIVHRLMSGSMRRKASDLMTFPMHVGGFMLAPSWSMDVKKNIVWAAIIMVRNRPARPRESLDGEVDGLIQEGSGSEKEKPWHFRRYRSL